MWSIHMVGYYSARRKDILTPATQVDLEDMMLSGQPVTKGQIPEDSTSVRSLESSSS